MQLNLFQIIRNNIIVMANLLNAVIFASMSITYALAANSDWTAPCKNYFYTLITTQQINYGEQ